MNLCAEFPVTIAGQTIVFKPLTVRQRLAFGNTIIERERERAVANGKAAGLSGRELAASISEAVHDAERVSFVVMSAFTLEGALIVLAMAADEKAAELAGSFMEPGDLGVLAARCLGVGIASKPETSAEGN
jgi:hypothetical protein